MIILCSHLKESSQIWVGEKGSPPIRKCYSCTRAQLFGYIAYDISSKKQPMETKRGISVGRTEAVMEFGDDIYFH